MEKPIPPSEYLENGNKTIYVRGVVRYKDFTGEWTSFGSDIAEDCDTGKNQPNPN